MPTGSYAPGATPKDDMRLLCGDVEEPFLMGDDEIAALYSAPAGRYSSASAVALAMAARLSSLVDTGAEGAYVRNSQRAEAMRKLSDAYRAEAFRQAEAGFGASSPGGVELVVDDPRDAARARYDLYHPAWDGASSDWGGTV